MRFHNKNIIYVSETTHNCESILSNTKQTKLKGRSYIIEKSLSHLLGVSSLEIEVDFVASHQLHSTAKLGFVNPRARVILNRGYRFVKLKSVYIENKNVYKLNDTL